MINKIIIVDDNKEVRESFQILINSISAYHVIATFESCEMALEKLPQLRPDIVLMDLNLPGINGIEGIKRIKKIFPDIIVIVITIFENSEKVFEALCAGAVGYLTKNTDYKQLLSALEEATTGGAPMSSNIARMVVNSFHKAHDNPLTGRETEVVTWLAKGVSYTGIAERLRISRDTVRYHLKNIYIKLQSTNKAEAIEAARQKKII